jgi:osmotically-inducible protein OsmY
MPNSGEPTHPKEACGKPIQIVAVRRMSDVIVVARRALPVLAALAALALAGCQRSYAEAETTGGAAQPLPSRGETHALSPSSTGALVTATPTGLYEPLNDVALAGRIRASLLADPALAGADISVNADRGVVVLTGTVKSQEQVAIASAHAQREDGVMRVDNHLGVNPS